VVLDLIPDPSIYCQSFEIELTAKNYRKIYIPEGRADRFETLTDNPIVFYRMYEFYHPEASPYVRGDDLMFKIRGPLPVENIAEKDGNYPDFKK